MKYIYVIFAMLGTLQVNAQDQVEYQHCQETIEEARELHSDGDYHAAYEKMCEINENDSCYIRSIVNRTFYLLNDTILESDFRYNEVIRLTQEGIDSEITDSKYLHYLNQMAAYINLEKYEQAHEVINKALLHYPAKDNLYVKRGVIYEHQEKYDKAAKAYQESLKYNPFNPTGHLQLGLLCYRSDKITQALLCFNTYLSISPEGENSFRVLDLVNHMVSNKYDEELIEVQVSEDDDAFEDIDLLIRNEIALQSKYKVKHKLKELAIVKQNHLLLNQLKTIETNGGFFEKKYIPFFNQINASKEFEAFNYTICYSIQNPRYKKITDTKINDVKRFYSYALNQVVDMYSENEMVFDGVKNKYTCEYSLEGITALKTAENDRSIQDWVFFKTEDGSFLSKGSLDNNNKKIGEWVWYFDDGSKKFVSEYKDGLVHGPYKEFHPNGQLNYELNYENDEAEGVFKKYNKYGALTEEKTFVKNKLNGPFLEYYDTGEDFPKFDYGYSDEAVNGLVQEFFPTGQKKMEVNFTKGERDGQEKNFFSNGQLSSEVTMVNGESQGDFITYFADGVVFNEGKFVDGKAEGVWTYYHHNGKVSSTRTFLKGVLDGDYLQYDLDGIKEFYQIYKKGNLHEVFYYNKSGEEIYNIKKKKGELYYKAYSPQGILTAEGLYDIEGGKEGEWKYYNENGLLFNTILYKDGMQTGDDFVYYPNGELKISGTYKEDKLDGYYLEKYPDGKLSYQGWYIDGERQGTFYSYYPNEKVKSSAYYINGLLNGRQIDFGIDGDTIDITHYAMGEIVRTDFFNANNEIFEAHQVDTKANASEDYFYANGDKRATYQLKFAISDGPFVAYYPGGKVSIEGTFVNGKRHGKWTWYHENGKIDSQYDYIYGDIDGVVKEYDEQGKISNESYYLMGKKHGESTAYNSAGVVTNITPYEYGVLQGKRYFYSEGGQLQLIRFYNNDYLIGYSYMGKDGKELPMIPIENETAKIIAYYDNGKVSREMEIIKGSFEGEYNAYYYSGQIEAISIYENDERQGIQFSYFSDGKVLTEKDFSNGLKHGLSKTYYANGKLKSQKEYQYGLAHGDFITYSSTGKILSNRKYKNDNFVGNN